MHMQQAAAHIYKSQRLCGLCGSHSVAQLLHGKGSALKRDRMSIFGSRAAAAVCMHCPASEIHSALHASRPEASPRNRGGAG